MPPRFNLFQDVVAIIERHKAAGTVIDESAELIDRDTGEKREVDVTVTATVDGAKVVIGIEAADRSRPADVTWVEQQIAKHDAVGTDQLVLVAGKGFYEPARRKAVARGAVTITPEDLPDDDHEFAVISKVAAPPVVVEPRLAGAALDVDNPPGTTMVGTPDSARKADGSPADLDGIAHAIFDRHFDGFIAKAAEDLSKTGERRFGVRERPPEPLFAEARYEGGAVVRVPIVAVQIDVTVDVQPHPEMNMFARLFADTATLYGETKLEDAQAIFVATENAGTIRATLRTREPGEHEPVDWAFDGAIDIAPPDA